MPTPAQAAPRPTPTTKGTREPGHRDATIPADAGRATPAGGAPLPTGWAWVRRDVAARCAHCSAPPGVRCRQPGGRPTSQPHRVPTHRAAPRPAVPSIPPGHAAPVPGRALRTAVDVPCAHCLAGRGQRCRQPGGALAPKPHAVRAADWAYLRAKARQQARQHANPHPTTTGAAGREDVA